jgi:hypothetical protein
MTAQNHPKRRFIALSIIMLTAGATITSTAEAHDHWDHEEYREHHRSYRQPLIQFSFGAPLEYKQEPVYYAPPVYLPPRPIYRPVTYYPPVYYPAPVYRAPQYYPAYHCPRRYY